MIRQTKKYPKVSIVIPLYIIVERFFQDLKKFEALDYPSYEVLIVCDKTVDLSGYKKSRLLKTGKRRTGPAEKRDIALKKATGSILAFIDDDAYPPKDWLKKAVRHFSNSQIAAVGGPGVTPFEDNYLEQVTGIVYSSFFCSGFAKHRFVPADKQFEVVDYPAYNLIVRKSVLKKVGGYGTHFYGGEDTFLCLKIVKLGLKILYDPEVLVYHHRRALFIPYLKQIANVGKHRGYFAKTYPETSSYFWYFLPAVAASGFLLLLLLSFVSKIAFMVFIIGFIIAWSVGFLSVIKKSDVIKSSLASFGIIATHLAYGFSFIKGLLTRDLTR